MNRVIPDNCQEKLIAYYKIALKPNLSSEDEDILEKILDDALDDQMLSSGLNIIDIWVAEKLELLTPEQLSEYENQKAFLREHLEPEIVAKTHSLNKVIQEGLKELNYYNGPIDGVRGQRTEKAVKNFQKDNSLNADGIPDPCTREKIRTLVEGRLS